VVVSQRAQRALITELPGGDAVYRRACRAYTDTVYGALLEAGGKPFFLDKTPANALVLPYLTALYPEARYLVLTRHPAAIFTSYADSFFGGDFSAAARHNPVVARYVTAIGHLLRAPPTKCLHLHYESLVAAPEATLEQLGDWLGHTLSPAALDYQRVPMEGTGPGDPLGVPRHTRPVPGSAERWVSRLVASPEGRAVIDAQLSAVDPRDLRAWGVERDFWSSLDGADGSRAPRRWDRFSIERRLLVRLRRAAQRPRLRRLVEKGQDVCDVLLRG